MQAVRLGVVRNRRFRVGDGFTVCGNGGSGTIDYDHPVTPTPVPLWLGVSPSAGHLRGGHLLEPALDSLVEDGHTEGTHLLDDHLIPAGLVEFTCPAVVFGRFRYAVVMRDAVGNERLDLSSEHQQTINSAPAGPRDLVCVAQEPEGGQLTFRFEPGGKLCG